MANIYRSIIGVYWPLLSGSMRLSEDVRHCLEETKIIYKERNLSVFNKLFLQANNLNNAFQIYFFQTERLILIFLFPPRDQGIDIIELPMVSDAPILSMSPLVVSDPESPSVLVLVLSPYPE